MRTTVQTNVRAEEYLQMEEVAERKHEFVYGNLFEMPGTTLRHNRLMNRLISLFNALLLHKGYEAFSSDVKVEAVKNEVFFYPDITIAKIASQDKDSYVIQEPILITEVLSPSTRTYDSVDKFIQYRRIASLQYYLLIEPEKHVITFYEKSSSGEWQSDTFTELREILQFPILGASVSLATIYES